MQLNPSTMMRKNPIIKDAKFNQVINSDKQSPIHQSVTCLNVAYVKRSSRMRILNETPWKYCESIQDRCAIVMCAIFIVCDSCILEN